MWIFFNSCRGDSQGRFILYIRSPLSEPVLFCIFLLLFNLNVGEIHRVAKFLYSRSPLSEPDKLLILFLVNSCRGDSQGSLNL